MKFFKSIALSFLFGSLAFAAPAPVPSDLVAWYPGDGNANDISGNLLNPSQSFGPPSFQAGKVLQAMRFFVVPPAVSGGSDAGYSVPDSDLLDVGASDSFSIEFWASAADTSGIIADKREVVNNQAKGYAIYKNFNGTLHGGNGCNISINFHQPGMPTASAIVEPISCTHGFRHFAFTFERPENRIRVYIDGVLRSSVVPSIMIGDLSNGSPLFIAHRSSGFFSEFPWPGGIDELSFYKKALSAAEISAIHNAGGQGKEKAAAVPLGMQVAARTGDLTATFPSVTTAGSLRQFSLDPMDLPALPLGHISTDLFYDVSTTASFTGNASLCFELPLFENASQFLRLRIFHLEAGNWVDVTTSWNFAARQLCGQSASFSPFAIAEALAPSVAAVSVSGRVLDASGRGIAKAMVSLANSRGEIIKAASNPFGYYHFEEVAAGEGYILSVERKGYSFQPLALTLTENLEGLNIVENQGSIFRKAR